VNERPRKKGFVCTEGRRSTTLRKERGSEGHWPGEGGEGGDTRGADQKKGLLTPNIETTERVQFGLRKGKKS